MSTNSMIKGTAKIIGEKYDRETVQMIVVDAQKRYEELIVDNRTEPKALKSHTHSRIYPGIALYESMKKQGIDSETAVWLIREYFQRMCKTANKAVQILLKLPGLYHKIPAFFVKMSVKSFSTDAGFEYRFPKEKNIHESRFDMVKCPYLETCKRYGCPEITTAFCDSDDATYANMHKNLLWGRTGTMGHGQECCDFKLTDVSKV